ncbi:MAG: hypothetical protein J7M25_14980 [Deltaproteobacteria bacterium]|nr:hypothetical protein [Deltaproteobacteria bacterium]
MVQRVHGLSPKQVDLDHRPVWRAQGACRFLEVQAHIDKHLPGDQTLKARRVLFVASGEEDMGWEADRAYSISETSEGPDDAVEEKQETGRWYRVGGKTLFDWTKSLNGSGK